MQADQVRGLCLREIGGGFSRHHRAPSIRAACYAIAKPSTMVQKMQHIKKLRGHLSAVYCGKLPCLVFVYLSGLRQLLDFSDDCHVFLTKIRESKVKLLSDCIRLS